MAETKDFTLYNGVRIPAVGYGTGIAKGLLHHPAKTARLLAREAAKNMMVPGFKENNNYPVIKDLKKEKNLKRVSGAALQAGCRLFDTARAYGFSESYLGESVGGGGSTGAFSDYEGD